MTEKLMIDPADICEGDAMRLMRDLRDAMERCDELLPILLYFILLYFIGSKSAPPQFLESEQ